jgi:hypothetical protein
MPRLILLLAVLALGFAPAPFLPKKPTRGETDFQIFQGVWAEMPSADSDTPSTSNVEYVFRGADVQVLQNRAQVSRWTMTLEVDKAPKRMILRAVGGGGILPYTYTLENGPRGARVHFKERGHFKRMKR